MKKSQSWSIWALPILILFSCVKDSLDAPIDPTDPNAEVITAIDELKIPSGFAFKTEREITLTISDQESTTRYSVLVGGVEVANTLIVEGGTSISFNVPDTTSKITLVRRTARTKNTISVKVSGTSLNYTHTP